MSRLLKFVAVLLVMTVGVIPVLAAAPCSETAGPGMHCPPGCPMRATGKTAPVTQCGSQNPASPCCDMHSGKPIRTTELLAPSATASITSPLSTIACVANTESGVDDESLFLLPNLGSHQSLLCTFLI